MLLFVFTVNIHQTNRQCDLTAPDGGSVFLFVISCGQLQGNERTLFFVDDILML